MSSKLSGKVAVVTGASKGIGAEIARQLAAAGASVVVNYASSKAGADKVVADITKAGGKAVAVQGDVSKEADVKRLFAEAKTAYDHVDILVNNAGVYEFAPLEGITAEHFYKHYNLNVLGLLLATKEAAAQFGPSGGSVINVSSAVTTITPPNSAVYTSTKAAVDAVSKVLAKELGAKKIRVNSINPGLVETEGTQALGFHNADSEFNKWAVSTTPLGRIGQPNDIAPVVVFLASDDAKWVTGEALFASGGSR